jgi:uncharacterized protein (DUF1778 family)
MAIAKISKETLQTGRNRDASINIRAHKQQRDLIDRAVTVLGKNRSDFMLEAACKEANNVLLSRRYFPLGKKDFDRFMAALDKSPAKNDLLRRTLASSPPWKR